MKRKGRPVLAGSKKGKKKIKEEPLMRLLEKKKKLGVNFL